MSELKDIYIIGAGGSGREVADTIHAINSITPKYKIAGFIDSDISKHNEIINGIEVKGDFDYLARHYKNTNKKECAIISVGNPLLKEKIAFELNDYVEWENIIHPTVVLSDFAELGHGVLIQAQGFIGANVSIGNHVQVNAKSNVSHDSIVGDYASIMCLCDITGNVTIGSKAYIASSVSVIPGRIIGEMAKIGAGSTILKDVRPNVTMHGYMAMEAKHE